MTLLLDTSGIFALADAEDDGHIAVQEYLEATEEVLVLPVTVLPEADYFLATRLGRRTEIGFLRAVLANEFRLEPLTSADLGRCVELIKQYADSEICLVDASIVALAERLHITKILTLDRRHFRMFRPRHCEAFELVP